MTTTKAPTLHRVSWLADRIGVTLPRAYALIAEGHIPADCVVRIGRSIRIIEERFTAWLLSQQATA